MRAAAALNSELASTSARAAFDFNKAVAVARDLLNKRPRPDYMIATNDVGVGGEIVRSWPMQPACPLILFEQRSQREDNGRSMGSHAPNSALAR